MSMLFGTQRLELLSDLLFLGTRIFDGLLAGMHAFFCLGAALFVITRLALELIGVNLLASAGDFLLLLSQPRLPVLQLADVLSELFAAHTLDLARLSRFGSDGSKRIPVSLPIADGLFSGGQRFPCTIASFARLFQGGCPLLKATAQLLQLLEVCL